MGEVHAEETRLVVGNEQCDALVVERTRHCAEVARTSMNKSGYNRAATLQHTLFRRGPIAYNSSNNST
eukprot:scaffold20283_cov57-Phaeocystis_antarctica.AAC.2